MLEFLVGLAVGVVVAATIAHFKPNWFAKVVAEVNVVENKASDAVNSTAASVANTVESKL